MGCFHVLGNETNKNIYVRVSTSKIQRDANYLLLQSGIHFGWGESDKNLTLESNKYGVNLQLSMWK